MTPEAGGDREKEEFVEVFGVGRAVGQIGVAAEGELLSPKKPSRLKSISSQQRFRQVRVSVSSSGRPKVWFW